MTNLWELDAIDGEDYDGKWWLDENGNPIDGCKRESDKEDEDGEEDEEVEI